MLTTSEISASSQTTTTQNTDSPKKRPRENDQIYYDTYIFYAKKRNPKHVCIRVPNSLESATTVWTKIVLWLHLLQEYKDDDSREKAQKTLNSFAEDLEFFILSKGAPATPVNEIAAMISPDEVALWEVMHEDSNLPVRLDWLSSNVFLLNSGA